MQIELDSRNANNVSADSRSGREEDKLPLDRDQAVAGSGKWILETHIIYDEEGQEWGEYKLYRPKYFTIYLND